MYSLTVWEVRNPKVKVSAGLCALGKLWGRTLLPLSSSGVCRQSLAFPGMWHHSSNLCLLPPCVSDSLSSHLVIGLNSPPSQWDLVLTQLSQRAYFQRSQLQAQGFTVLTLVSLGGGTIQPRTLPKALVRRR